MSRLIIVGFIFFIGFFLGFVMGKASRGNKKDDSGQVY